MKANNKKMQSEKDMIDTTKLFILQKEIFWSIEMQLVLEELTKIKNNIMEEKRKII